MLQAGPGSKLLVWNSLFRTTWERLALGKVFDLVKLGFDAFSLPFSLSFPSPLALCSLESAIPHPTTSTIILECSHPLQVDHIFTD